MDVVTGAVSAAVVPTADAIGRLRALDAASVTIRGGFWADRLRINRERTIPHGFKQLVRAGNLTNLRLAAGEKGHYQTLGEPLGLAFPFLDSDVYKWLEAVGWELGRAPDSDLARSAAGGEPAPAPAAIEIRAIPYFAWANRAGGAMRVWLPTTVERRPEDIDDDPR